MACEVEKQHTLENKRAVNTTERRVPMLPSIVFLVSWAFIVYTYVGFPFLLALLARRFGTSNREALADNETLPRDGAPPAVVPHVAMVVAAYNEADCLGQKLDNTWAIDYPADRFSLVVGSDGSSDQTNAILAACSDSRLLAYPFPVRRGKISVLNDLMARVQAETNADIVVMSDANTLFAPDAVRKLAAHFDDPRVGCVSGELGLEQNGGVSGEGLYWKYEGFIKRNESKLGFLIGCNGGIFALRPSVYEPLPASVIVEDFVLTLRILEKGWRVRFEPQARATEPPCPTSRAEMIRKIRIGAGNFQALTLTSRLLLPTYGLISFAYWGHKVLRWMVSFFFIIAVAANIALAQPSNRQDHVFYRALLLIQFTGAAIAAWSYHTPPGSIMPKWTRPISYFYLMNYALLCGFFRFVFGTQRVTWERASR